MQLFVALLTFEGEDISGNKGLIFKGQLFYVDHPFYLPLNNHEKDSILDFYKEVTL
jgi:hypothetical protein